VVTRGTSRLDTQSPEQGVIAIDGTPVSSFKLERAGQYRLRVPVVAGTREIVVTFPDVNRAEFNQLLEPYDRPLPQRDIAPPLKQLDIAGPFDSEGDGAAIKPLLVCRPGARENQAACARRIVAPILRRAYRRPVTPEDVNAVVAFSGAGRTGGSFEDT